MMTALLCGMRPADATKDDTTPPALVSSSRTTANTITLVYNETLASTAPTVAAFTIHTPLGNITPVAVAVSGATVVITAASALGVNLTLDYVPPALNPIRDVAGNVASSFTGRTITI